jgi:hypothetical protein
MPRSFNVVTDSPNSVDQLHTTFGLEAYWLARLGGDVSATLDSLNVEPDGTVAVQVTQYLGRQLLPALAAKVVPGDLKLLYRETWRPIGDGRIHGDISVSAAGGLGSSRAENWLEPAGVASQLRSAVNVEVKIPLVGGQLEKAIGAGLAASIPATLAFTSEWIAENA